MKTWILLDCHNLCYRALYALPKLSWEGRPTEVIYGFLQSLQKYRDTLMSERMVFCFDHPVSFRKRLFPAYKEKRHDNLTPAEKRFRSAFQEQLEALKELLPRAGFHNVFCFHGMESDDVLAMIARTQSSADENVILVTSDSDLLQCLSDHVRIYSPHYKRILTRAWFVEKYGIVPQQWATVKALAGCVGDGVPGIRGVGELTALRYLKGELNEKHAPWKKIACADGKAILRRNLQLVRLPGPNCPAPLLRDEEWDEKAWHRALSSLGIQPKQQKELEYAKG